MLVSKVFHNTLLFLCCAFGLLELLQFLSKTWSLIHLWIWKIDNIVVVWIVWFMLDFEQTSCTWGDFWLYPL